MRMLLRAKLQNGQCGVQTLWTALAASGWHIRGLESRRFRFSGGLSADASRWAASSSAICSAKMQRHSKTTTLTRQTSRVSLFCYFVSTSFLHETLGTRCRQHSWPSDTCRDQRLSSFPPLACALGMRHDVPKGGRMLSERAWAALQRREVSDSRTLLQSGDWQWDIIWLGHRVDCSATTHQASCCITKACVVFDCRRRFPKTSCSKRHFQVDASRAFHDCH